MKTVNKGIVYLIGAGPGDPELITVRGKQLLQRCEAVIYDNLVPRELIITLPSRTGKYYVGKKAGKHTMPQKSINELMVKLAGEGKDVARLKGGDPYIFGRGGEEALYLNEHDIEFEIVPGVTAGVAGPAYAGIPSTDRAKASYVVFATGHKAKEKDTTSVPWDWLAKSKNGTIVIYMGVSEFVGIVKTLIENGMSPDTPAAVIERGTFPSQRVIKSSLEKLPKRIEDANIRPPALFVIGDVVNLQERLTWLENRPLLGKRVMVCRPADQAQAMYQNLRLLGAEVLPYPTIATETQIDDDAWEAFSKIDTQSPADNWLVFTSENGIRYFIEQFVSLIGDIRYLGNFKIAAVGFGTARALKKYSLKADFIPTKATTGFLAREMVESINLEGATVVRVRGNLADDGVENILSEVKANVIPMLTYRTFCPRWPDGFKENLFEYPPDVVIFTSGSSVDGLFEILNQTEIDILMAKSIAVSIGPMTSKIIESRDITVAVEATEHSVPGIIDELLDHFKGDK
ncbi:MAG: uroporphyrinogen-III C-methyltransferase [candidate division Zixibacteria bacterium]|nr:uroporphyrinogen-III C-methyltransferase [candidate division Zixibacteria bacterium]